MANANPLQPEEVNIDDRENSRGIIEFFITGKHVGIETLKDQMLKGPMVDYLKLEMPPYPTPVEFWVSDVTHVTVRSGLEGILESEQFRPGAGETPLSWWGLKINKEEIRAAEKRYMDENFPNEVQELNENFQPFLEDFTTSPAFQTESRYGSYRFTFPLTDLMQWYKEQNCGGEEPVLRVYETVTYKQEIMYTVLIHSPEDNGLIRFREYPLLEASQWVRYQDGKIIWKAQAICETHNHQFVAGEVQKANAKLKYFVWDHVCLVFHLPNDKVLKIPRQRLIRALEACEVNEIDLSRDEDKNKNKEKRFIKAKNKVSDLKTELEEEEKESKEDDHIKNEVESK